MGKLGMILEGGGVRGIYTAGVLDVLMDHQVKVDAIFGVSAGALHGLNYTACQKHRSYRITTAYIRDKRYLSMQSFIRTGDIFGAKFCYQTIPDELDPFDYETFRKNTTKLYATVSNLETGKAEYILCDDAKKKIDYIRASASLPLLSRIVEIDGKKYLDGGICDSIPLKKAQEKGFYKNIVILTRVKGYQKEQSKMLTMMRYQYRSYPEFVKAAVNRHINYNETLAYVEREEEKGNCFVIRPSELISVSRLERDITRINQLYELGKKDANDIYSKLMDYIKLK